MISQALTVAINAALAAEAAKFVCEKVPKNIRKGRSCAAPACSRSVYASGYCNAHYLRIRSGADMAAPIRHSGALTCRECQKPVGKSGGWGLCQRHYRRARTSTIKAAVVAALGGSCSKCAGVYPLCVFDFHHVGQKDASVSALIANGSPEAIGLEISKCVLLCANCHRLEHFDGPN